MSSACKAWFFETIFLEKRHFESLQLSSVVGHGSYSAGHIYFQGKLRASLRDFVETSSKSSASILILCSQTTARRLI